MDLDRESSTSYSTDINSGYIIQNNKPISSSDLYSYSFNRNLIKISYTPSLSPSSRTLFHSISSDRFSSNGIDCEIAFVNGVFLNDQPYLIVVTKILDEVEETENNDEENDFYSVHKLNIYTQEIQELGFELKNIVEISVNESSTIVLFAASNEGYLMSMPLKLDHKDQLSFSESLAVVEKVDPKENENTSVVLIGTKLGNLFVYEYKFADKCELVLKSKINTGYKGYIPTKANIYWVNSSTQNENKNVDVFSLVKNRLKLCILSLFKDQDNNTSLVFVHELHANKGKGPSWKSFNTLELNAAKDGYITTDIYILNCDLQTNRDDNMLMKIATISKRNSVENENLNNITFWKLEGDELFQIDTSEFVLNDEDTLTDLVFLPESNQIEMISLYGNYTLFEYPKALLPIERNSKGISLTTDTESYVPEWSRRYNNVGVDITLKCFSELDKEGNWGLLLKNNRKSVSGELFIDKMLLAVGIDDSTRLYPPTSYTTLKQLIDKIVQSSSDTLKVNSLLFYILLDYDLVSKTTGILQNFSTDTCLPYHFQLLVYGYWCLDNNQVDHGLHCLCDLLVDADWSRDIVYTAVMSGCYDGAKHFIDVVRPSLDTYGTDANLIMQVYLNSSIEQAFWFQRDIAMNVNSSEDVKNDILDSLFLFSSKSAEFSNQLVCLPLNIYEESRLFHYCCYAGDNDTGHIDENNGPSDSKVLNLVQSLRLLSKYLVYHSKFIEAIQCIDVLLLLRRLSQDSISSKTNGDKNVNMQLEEKLGSDTFYESAKKLRDNVFMLLSKPQKEILSMLKKVEGAIVDDTDYFGGSVEEFALRKFGQSLYSFIFSNAEGNETQKFTVPSLVSPNSSRLITTPEKSGKISSGLIKSPHHALTPHQTLLRAVIRNSVNMDAESPTERIGLQSTIKKSKRKNVSFGFGIEPLSKDGMEPRIPSPSLWRAGRTPKKSYTGIGTPLYSKEVPMVRERQSLVHGVTKPKFGLFYNEMNERKSGNSLQPIDLDTRKSGYDETGEITGNDLTDIDNKKRYRATPYPNRKREQKRMFGDYNIY
ncbi:hypothetical protein BB558_003499 [Smittium angustum]|uniref:ELYS-like domain-containing protein n=1 Tax=Smittium angustum TaxID=133377 RepID=A0A2U1J5W7_SMIAN|nr:hypothetical protein BB558_003499 [Smittium angustum]